MAGPWRNRKRKAHSALRINYGHPLARDIAFCYIESYGMADNTAGYYDAVTGKKTGNTTGVSAGTLTDIVGGGRSSLRGVGNTNTAIASTAFSNPRSVQTSMLSMFVRCKLNTKPTSERCVAAYFGAGNSFRGPVCGFTTQGYALGGTMTSNGLPNINDGIDHTGQWVNFFTQANGNTAGGWEGYVDAIPSLNGFSGSSADQTPTGVWLFRDSSNYFKSFEGEMPLIIGWNRPMSRSEINSINANPWQIFLPANDISLFALLGSAAAGITGDAAMTDPNDTVSSAGVLTITGAGAMTDPNDTVSSAGVLTITGAGAVNDPNDTVSSAGNNPITGTCSITDPDDTVSSAGTNPITGTCSITDPDDTCAATGSVGGAIGSAGMLDANDIVAAVGVLTITGTVGITDPNETLVSAGANPITGAGSMTDPNDMVVSAASLTITGAGVIIDPNDICNAAASLNITGAGGMLDDNDTLVSFGRFVGGAPNPRRFIVARRRATGRTAHRRITSKTAS